MVVAASRNERRLVAEALLELEAEDTRPELERTVDVGDLEVNVADVGARVDRHGVSLLCCALKRRLTMLVLERSLLPLRRRERQLTGAHARVQLVHEHG